MSNLKKLFCRLLTVSMLLSTLMLSAGATYQDQAKIKHTEAVEKLAAMNIMKGKDNGKFEPEAFVTRAEMCKILCLALNRGIDPKLDTFPILSSSFTDTKGHWAENYIEYCRNLDSVSGMGDGQFKPNAPITGVQLAKMMLVPMGYSTDYTGDSWELSVSIFAEDANLYKQLENFDPKKPVCRDDAAQIVYNAMMASMVEYKLTPTGKSMFDKFYKGKLPDLKS